MLYNSVKISQPCSEDCDAKQTDITNFLVKRSSNKLKKHFETCIKYSKLSVFVVNLCNS